MSFLVVNYSSGYRLARCVRAIRETVKAHYEIVIVDNASQDGSTNGLDAPDCRVVRLDHNIGWGGAIGLAYQHSTGQFVHVITPDVYVQPGTVDGILGELASDTTLGAMGGYAVRPDGSFDKYHNTLPTPLALFLTVYVPRRIARRCASFRRYHMHDASFEGRTVVEQPAGHCLLLRREYFPESVARGDWGQHFADVEIAASVLEHGGRIEVDEMFRVTHDHAPATPDHNESVVLTTDFLVGAIQHFRARGRPGAARRLKLLWVVGQLARVAMSAGGSLLQRHSWERTLAEARVLHLTLGERNLFTERVYQRAPTGPESEIPDWRAA